MSFAEIIEALPSLSEHERVELQESLQALAEGMTVEEFRAMNAALEEELNDPSPRISAEEMNASIESWKPRDAA